MTTYRRDIISVPARSADESWRVIVELIAGTSQSAARDELLSVSGIASSVIADMAPRDSAIVATCNGPRTRFYCIYDDDALDADSANEAKLQHDAINGDWRVSLPCLTDDLGWIATALAKHSSRITARDANDGDVGDQADSKSVGSGTVMSSAGTMDVDLKGLFS